MTFGDVKDFAIEAYHEPSGPKWAGFGRMCVHIQGVMLGNIRDNHCSLFHATDRLRAAARTAEKLWHESLSGLSSIEIFHLLDRELYIGEPTEMGPIYDPFNFLNNTGEMFNGVKSFIVCDSGGSVQILYRFRDNNIGAGFCSVDSFRQVADAYALWFDEQVRTIAAPYFPINPFDLNEKVPEDWKN
jgi:hypothetical protein